LLKQDCRQPTYHAKLYRRPCFSIKIPLDTRKQRFYTPNRQKQCLINSLMWAGWSRSWPLSSDWAGWSWPVSGRKRS